MIRKASWCYHSWQFQTSAGKIYSLSKTQRVKGERSEEKPMDSKILCQAKLQHQQLSMLTVEEVETKLNYVK